MSVIETHTAVLGKAQKKVVYHRTIDSIFRPHYIIVL